MCVFVSDSVGDAVGVRTLIFSEIWMCVPSLMGTSVLRCQLTSSTSTFGSEKGSKSEVKEMNKSVREPGEGSYETPVPPSVEDPMR